MRPLTLRGGPWLAGGDDDAIGWTEVLESARGRSRLRVTYFVMMARTGILAGIGVLQAQPLLLLEEWQ